MTASQEMIKTAAKTESALSAYNPEQLDHLRKYLAPGFDDSELAFFLAVAQQKGLNPLTRQVHAIKRKQKQKQYVNGRYEEQWITKVDVLTGIDGYRAIAARCGDYAPGDETVTLGESGLPASATVSVRKLVRDTWLTFSATAYFEEYAVYYEDKQTKRMELGGLWAKMPRRMITKCAEALALRKGWPEQLSDIYASEEFDRATNDADNAEQRFGAIPPEPARAELPPAQVVSIQQAPKQAEKVAAPAAAKPAPAAKQSMNPNKPPKWQDGDAIPDIILNALPKITHELRGIPLRDMQQDDLDLIVEQGKQSYNKWSAVDAKSPALRLLSAIVVSAEALASSHHGDTPPPVVEDFDQETGEVRS